MYSFAKLRSEPLPSIINAAKLAASKRRGGRGRTSRAAMKSNKINAVSVLPKGSVQPDSKPVRTTVLRAGVLQVPSAAESASLPSSTTGQVDQKSHLMGFDSWGTIKAKEAVNSLVVPKGYCLKYTPGNKVEDLEFIPPGEGDTSQVKNVGSGTRNREKEVLGPNEWLDREIMRLNFILQGGAVNSSGLNITYKEQRENGTKKPDVSTGCEKRAGGLLTAQEQEMTRMNVNTSDIDYQAMDTVTATHVVRSYADNNEWPCFAAMNSGYVDEWLNWDLSCGVKNVVRNNEWEISDHEGERMPSLWESGISTHGAHWY